MGEKRAKRRRRDRKREKKRPGAKREPVLAGGAAVAGFPDVVEILRDEPGPPYGTGFEPPSGGAGVREPRRPKPHGPHAGAVALEAPPPENWMTDAASSIEV